MLEGTGLDVSTGGGPGMMCAEKNVKSYETCSIYGVYGFQSHCIIAIRALGNVDIDEELYCD